jgi:hypothetical protein
MPHTGKFTISPREYLNSAGKKREGITIDASYTLQHPGRGPAEITSQLTNVSKIFMEASGRDPATFVSIEEFYYEERASTGYIVLVTSPQLANQGWGTILADHNRLMLHRTEASLYSAAGGKTKWEWSFNDSFSTPRAKEYAKDFLRKSPQQGSTSVSTFSETPITFTIVDEKVVPRTPVLIKSDGTAKAITFDDAFDRLGQPTYWRQFIQPFLGDESYRTTDLGEYKHTIDVYYNDTQRVVSTLFNGKLDDVPTVVSGNFSPFYGSTWTRGTLEVTNGLLGDQTSQERLYSVSGFDPMVEGGAAVTNTTLPTLTPGEAIGLNFDLDVYDRGLKSDTRSSNARQFVFEETPNMGPSLINATNCRALFNVESAFEVTDTTFKIHGPIFAGDIASASLPKMQPGTTQHRDAMVGKRIRSYDGTFEGIINDIEYRVTTKTADLYDIDLDGVIDALTDGLLVLRYLFGLRGDALIVGAISEEAQRNTAEAVESYIAALLNPDNFRQTPYGDRSHLDFDVDGVADALTDGLLFFRYLFGMTGSSLTGGAVSITTPLTDDEINAYIDVLINLQAQVDELNRFVKIGGSAGSGSAVIEEGVNETLITYQPLSQSIRQKPVEESLGYQYGIDSFLSAEHSHLYIELESTMQPVANTFSIDDTIDRFGVVPYRGRTSSFQMLYWQGGRNYRVFTNVPPVILEPTFKGAFGATLGAYIGGGVTDGEILHPTFCHISGLSAGLHHPEFGTAQHAILSDTSRSKSNLVVAPSGEPILVTIKRKTNYETVVVEYDTSIYRAENCSIELVRDDMLAVEGSMDFIVTPGTPGKRFKNTISVQYRRVVDNVAFSEQIIHFIEGKVADPVNRITVGPYVADSWYNDQSNISSEFLISTLKGTQALNLFFDIPEADRFASLESKGKGHWVQTDSLAKILIDSTTNCKVENRAVPLKVTTTSGEIYGLDTSTSYRGSYGADGISVIGGEEGLTTFSVAGRLEVVIPWQTQDESSLTHKTRTYPFTLQGEYRPEYGLEILNDDGGTRLNMSSEPFRVTAMSSGLLGRIKNADPADVTYLNNSAYSLEGGYYWKHTYTATGQKDIFDRHLYRNIVEIYWDGERKNRVDYVGNRPKSWPGRSVRYDQTYYDPSLPVGQTSDGTVLGPSYFRSGQDPEDGDDKDNGTNGIDYYELEQQHTLIRWSSMYSSQSGPEGGKTSFDVHQVPFANYENVETAKFIIVNNSPESRVQSVIHPDNTSIINRPFEYSIDPNTGQVFPGKIWENTTEHYAKIVIRID